MRLGESGGEFFLFISFSYSLSRVHLSPLFSSRSHQSAIRIPTSQHHPCMAPSWIQSSPTAYPRRGEWFLNTQIPKLHPCSPQRFYSDALYFCWISHRCTDELGGWRGIPYLGIADQVKLRILSPLLSPCGHQIPIPSRVAAATTSPAWWSTPPTADLAWAHPRLPLDPRPRPHLRIILMCSRYPSLFHSQPNLLIGSLSIADPVLAGWPARRAPPPLWCASGT